MSRPVRTLLFSTLYPSSERPNHGIFVQTRLRELLKQPGVHTRVVAPVPWFYSTDARHGQRAAMARTPRQELWNGIDVQHPRYALVPKVGMTIAPLSLALGARPAVRQLLSEGFDFDLIDAHYYYPDGVAAALLAHWFAKPFVVTARGSDVNLIGEYLLPRQMMRRTAMCAHASIAVSKALAQRLLALGAPQASVQVLPNGVDGTLFFPVAQAQARKATALQGYPVLLSVGNLLPVKRHQWVIEAFAQLRQRHPDAQLAIVGGGPLQGELRDCAARLGVATAVVFAGAVPQDELRQWYSAADLLVLASSREGWPNVLLEAMSCGTPVLASRVGGVPEIIQHADSGLMFDGASPASLRDQLALALSLPWDRDCIRRRASAMGWQQTSAGQLALFESIATAPRRWTHA